MQGILLKVKPGVPKTMDADDNPTFERWLQRVDQLLERCRGLSYQDLPDCNYRDWYERRMRPIHAANKALRGFCGE